MVLPYLKLGPQCNIARHFTNCRSFVCCRKVKNWQIINLHLPSHHKRHQLLAASVRRAKQLLLVVNQRLHQLARRKKARRWCWVGWWSWNQRNWWRRSWVDMFRWACWTRWLAGCLPRCYRRQSIFSPSLTARHLWTLSLRRPLSHVSSHLYHYYTVSAPLTLPNAHRFSTFFHQQS